MTVNDKDYMCPNRWNIIGPEDREEVDTPEGKKFSCNLCQHEFKENETKEV